MGKLGFPLSPERVARFEHARAALPASMPIAWLLGVEWVRASTPQNLSELVTLLTDVSLNNGGALDAIDTSEEPLLSSSGWARRARACSRRRS